MLRLLFALCLLLHASSLKAREASRRRQHLRRATVVSQQSAGPPVEHVICGMVPTQGHVSAKSTGVAVVRSHPTTTEMKLDIRPLIWVHSSPLSVNAVISTAALHLCGRYADAVRDAGIRETSCITSWVANQASPSTLVLYDLAAPYVPFVRRDEVDSNDSHGSRDLRIAPSTELRSRDHLATYVLNTLIYDKLWTTHACKVP